MEIDGKAYAITWEACPRVVEHLPDGRIRLLTHEERQALWDRGVDKGDLPIVYAACGDPSCCP